MAGTNRTNQLQTITDASGNNLGLLNGTTTYTYDGNGNLLTSTNPTATQNKTFTYNLLNLPKTAVTNSGGTSTYTYDATGRKLRKVNVNGSTNTTTEYIDGIQYKNSITAVDFIQTEEGRAVPNGTTAYDYTYYLADHLGNTRITFDTKTGSAVTLQKDDYYPFGMEILAATPVPNPKNEYLYNRKELQEETGLYDYGYRQYDPIIGRWTAPDMLAEVAPDLTSYRYCYNNPINYTDPFGLWEATAGGYKTSKPDDIERFMSYLDTEKGIGGKPEISDVISFVKDEKAGGLGKLTDGTKLLNTVKMNHYSNALTGIGGWQVNKQSFSDFWHQVQKDFNPLALDTRTWHNNILGLSYAGKNNPKNYLGQEDYTQAPDQIEDIPAFDHDIDFNNLKVAGPGPVFNDPRTQAANTKLVRAELKIALRPGLSPVTKARAVIVAVGIGAANDYNFIKNSPPDSGAPPIDP